MEIGDIYYPKTRQDWRTWLEKNHQKKSEVWLRLFRKDTGKPSLAYDDLVEVCLCFGWIDGVVKKLDEASRVQRITPRRKGKTFLSELNRQRVWKLEHLGLMTPAGLAALEGLVGSPEDALIIPDWIAEQLQQETDVWESFQNFLHYYQRLKIGWITEPKGNRQEERQKRLEYLIRMTQQGKRYGSEPLAGVFYDLDPQDE